MCSYVHICEIYKGTSEQKMNFTVRLNTHIDEAMKLFGAPF